MNTKGFSTNMSRLNREGMESANPKTRCDGHKKRRLDGQAAKGGLMKGFKRGLHKSPKNHGKAPRGGKFLTGGRIRKKYLHKL